MTPDPKIQAVIERAKIKRFTLLDALFCAGFFIVAGVVAVLVLPFWLLSKVTLSRYEESYKDSWL